MLAFPLSLTWTFSRVRIVARVGPLMLIFCNSCAGSSLSLMVGSCAGLYVASAPSDKAFFEAEKARDAQCNALMFLDFSGVPLLEVKVNLMWSYTAHSMGPFAT